MSLQLHLGQGKAGRRYGGHIQWRLLLMGGAGHWLNSAERKLRPTHPQGTHSRTARPALLVGA